MNEHDPPRDFVRQIQLTEYAGATYAFVAFESNEELRNLACRIVLEVSPPPSSWSFQGGLVGLRVHRGWVDAQSLPQTIGALGAGHLLLDRFQLHLRRIGDGMPYAWGTQEHFEYVKGRIGWPGLGLRGWGEPQDYVCGYSEHARLSRALPSMRPRPFGDWQKLGEFLGGTGSPLELGSSCQAFIECFAPTYARLIELTPTGPQTLAAAVESLLPDEADLHLLLDHDASLPPAKWPLAQAQRVGPHHWKFDIPRPDKSSTLRLVVTGHVVDTIPLPELTAVDAHITGAPVSDRSLPIIQVPNLQTILFSALAVSVPICQQYFNDNFVWALAWVTPLVAFLVGVLSHALVRLLPFAYGVLQRTRDGTKQTKSAGRIPVSSWFWRRLPSVFLVALVLGAWALLPGHSWSFSERMRAGHMGPPVCLAITPDGKYLASGDWGYIARIAGLDSGLPVAAQESAGLDHGAPVLDLALVYRQVRTGTSPINRLYLYSVTGRGEIIAWNLPPHSSEWSERRRLKHTGSATALAYDPELDLIVTAGADGVLRFTDAEDLRRSKLISSATINASPVLRLAVWGHKDAKAWVVAHANGTCELVWVGSGRVTTLRPPSDSLAYVALAVRDSTITFAGIEAEHDGSSDRRLTVERYTVDGSAERIVHLQQYVKHHSLRAGDAGSVGVFGDTVFVGYYANGNGPGRITALSLTGRTLVSIRTLDSVKAILPDPNRQRVLIADGARILSLDRTSPTMKPGLLVDDVQADFSALTWLNERELLTGDGVGGVWLWRRGAPLATRHVAQLPDSVVRLSPWTNHGALAVTVFGGTYHVYRLRERWQVDTLVAPLRIAVSSVAVDRKSKRIYLAQRNAIFTIDASRLPATKTPSPTCPDSITALETQRNGALFVGAATGKIYLHEPGTGFREVHNVVAPAIRSMQYAAKHRILAAVNTEGELQLYDEGNLDLKAGSTSTEHSSTLKVIVDPGARELMSVDAGYVIDWRDWSRKERVRRFGHPSDIGAVAIAPGGRYAGAAFGRMIDVYARSRQVP